MGAGEPEEKERAPVIGSKGCSKGEGRTSGAALPQPDRQYVGGKEAERGTMSGQSGVRRDIYRAMGPQPAPQPGYNQEEEVRRFQEQRRREEQERIRREQDFIRRRMAPRPEDPQMDARGQPYWPYGRPMVGGRITKEVIDVADNVPGINRITGPAKTIANMATGGQPPFLGDHPLFRTRLPQMTDKRSKGGTFKVSPPFDLSKYPPQQRARLAENDAFQARTIAGEARKQAQIERNNGNENGARYLEEVASFHDQRAQMRAREIEQLR